MWLAFLGEKKKATIYGWYQCIKDDELTRRLAELENLLFLAKKKKKKKKRGCLVGEGQWE